MSHLASVFFTLLADVHRPRQFMGDWRYQYEKLRLVAGALIQAGCK